MMERPKVLRVRLGYNPNSSTCSSLFVTFFSAVVFFWVVLSFTSTLFTSFIFADILFRKASKEKKIFPKIVFVALISLVFVGILFVFHNIPPLLPYPLSLINFSFIFIGLLTLSVILFVFTSLRIPAIIGGFSLIVGNLLVPFFCMEELYRLASLLGFYVVGFLIGYFISKRRRKDESSV
jgi:hypothetical protein